LCVQEEKEEKKFQKRRQTRHTTKSGAHQNVKTFDGPLSKQHLGDL
jgi:hypothetical protein